jgi:hypothetical protein
MKNKDQILLENIYESILLSEKAQVPLRSIGDFSEEEKKNILAKLSDVERSQLGTAKGGKSAKNYMSEDDWIVIRDFHLRTRLKETPQTNPNLCAYTPGETLKLLNNPIITDWFSMVQKFKIPEGKDKVIFVSCAASKRWGETTKSKDYQCYNMLRGQNSKIYWVTISEPLGIVPEDHWNDFPLYDNPGLFTSQGQVPTKFWLNQMGKQSSLAYPFDQKAFNECIGILGNVIKNFYDFNKKINPNLKFISAVETPSEKSTHSRMLDVSGILQQEERYQKAGKSATKEDRMSYWTDISNK